MKKSITKTQLHVFIQMVQKPLLVVCGLFFIMKIDAQIERSLSDSAFDPASNGKDKKYLVELVKTQNNKSIYLREGRAVWIMCETKKGRSVAKRARITEISASTITFLPNDKKFAIVSYKVDELPYIGYTTTGREVLAVTSGLLILPVNFILIMAGFFTGSFPGFYFYLYPVRKNVHLQRGTIADKLWDIRIVEENSVSVKKQKR